MNKKKNFLSGCDSNHSEKPAGAKSSNNQRVVNAATSNGCSLFSSSHEALKARVWVTNRELFERGGAFPYGSKPRCDLRILANTMYGECIEKTATEQEMLHLLDEAEKLGCRCEIIALDWFAYSVMAWQRSQNGVFTLYYNALGENEWDANHADAQRLGIQYEQTTNPDRLDPKSYNPQGGDDVRVLYYKYQTESGEVKYVIAFPHVLRKL